MTAGSDTPATPRAAVSEFEFRAACGLFPTGVTVVTRTLADGSPFGMTVSSFTSVSLQPPLVLVCIDRGARFLVNLPNGAPIAINVLSEHQQNIATRFANRLEDDRFAGAHWRRGGSGVPLLEGVVATFTCVVAQTVEGGDHLVLIAEVIEIQRHEGSPLVWCDRTYHALPARTNRQF